MLSLERTVTRCVSCASSIHMSMHHTLSISLCASIMSSAILASWCMHHWASIMAIASCHMHHFIYLGSIPSSCCPSNTIIHLMGASLSLWVHHYHGYRAFTLWVGALCHYFLVWWHCIGINKHELQLAARNSSDNKILSKDVPKSPPKPFFCVILTCHP